MILIALIVGIGIVGALLILLALSLDNTHAILKYFIVFFVITLMILIPKATLDFKGSNNNSTFTLNETVDGDTTLYIYDYQYPQNSMNTAVTFYKMMVRFVWAFVIYVFMYLNWLWWIKGQLIKKGWFSNKGT